MSKRATLAEQLAQISEPAPDFDPEDSYATYGQERSEEKRDLEAARSEYVDVGASKLRKKGEAVYDAKYAGKKGSRKDIYEAGSEEEEEGSEGSEDEELDGFEDLEGGSEEDEGMEDDSGEEEEGEDEEEEDEEKEAPVKEKKEKKSSSGKSRTTTTDQDEKAMLKQLKQAASADVDKGRDVKKQLALCDNLLEARIKIQKATTSANALPQASSSAAYFSLLPEELASTLAEVEALNEELFSLRRNLLRTNEQIELPNSFGSSRKRQRSATSPVSHLEYLQSSLADLATLESALDPFLRTTISKWSDKVLAASGLAIGQNKKFKAVNQNVLASIDHALASSERERLVRRTRVRRSHGVVVGGQTEEVVLEGEEKKREENECFDDGDFYQQLLRDVVESRMLDLDDPTLAGLRLASARGKKTKKVVDTRASKGRKIRYHVHEKIQSFMVPIDAGGWHEEQVDELFASLLGRSFPTAVDAEEEAKKVESGAGGAVDVGSLRIFG